MDHDWATGIGQIDMDWWMDRQTHSETVGETNGSQHRIMLPTVGGRRNNSNTPHYQQNSQHFWLWVSSARLSNVQCKNEWNFLPQLLFLSSMVPTMVQKLSSISAVSNTTQQTVLSYLPSTMLMSQLVFEKIYKVLNCVTKLKSNDTVMNAGARLAYSLCFSGHISDALVSLHWLRSTEWVMFKVAVLMFKAIHRSAPTYLSWLQVRVADLPVRHSLRSAHSNHLLVPSIRLSTVGGRAFPIAGPSIWNNLPDTVTSALTLRSTSDWKPVCSLSPSLTLYWTDRHTSSTVVFEVICITWTTLKFFLINWLIDWT